MFDNHLVSNIPADDMTKKIIRACSLEKDVGICDALGDFKNVLNGTATYVENEAKTTVEGWVDYLGIKEPVAVAGTVTKIIIDKRVRINRLKVPFLYNDKGSLEVSTDDIKWTIGWTF